MSKKRPLKAGASRKALTRLIVFCKNGASHSARILVGFSSIPASVGKNGVTTLKREGDGKTPRGKFPILWGYFRKDRIRRSQTRLRAEILRPDLGWCDDPRSPQYNRPVKLPFAENHEKLYRDDELYNVILVLGYNFPVTRKQRGSAIFLHIWKNAMTGTEGCVAIHAENMRKLLPRLSSKAVLVIRD